jgi:hypothetical protein
MQAFAGTVIRNEVTTAHIPMAKTGVCAPN